MKLLTKSEIEQQRNSERKLEIDEGMKIARRVDGLRRISAEEEGKLAAYGEANKQIVLGQLSDLVNERDGLRMEVVVLQEEREKLLEPLDAEWDKLALRNAELDGQYIEIRYKELAVREQEEVLAARIEDAVRAEGRIAEDRRQANRNLLDTDAMRREMAEAKEVFSAYLQKEVSDFGRRDAQLASSEENAVNREARAAAREKELDQRERRLNDEERRIKDLEDTLLRNKKR